MENKFLNNLKKIIIVNIKSKNITKTLKYIYNLNICIHDVTVINRKEVTLKIYIKDYKKLEEMRTIDEINIVDYSGTLKFKQVLKKNKVFLSCIVLGYIFLLFLSNVIFSIEIIHSNNQLRKFVKNLLNENGIKELSYRKTHNEIKEIKEKILIENKEKIEWIEIERVGTKYIIKIEERKKEEDKKNFIYQDIVSKKTAIIKKIEAENGEILKKINDYVTKGEVVISGKIYKNDEIVNIVKAGGKIYGEVWYNIKVEFPLVLNKKEETGNSKKVYVFKFLNHTFPLFDFKKYEYKTVVNNRLFFNQLLPIGVLIQEQYELKSISGIYSVAEAIIEAENYAFNKMEQTLDDDEYIVKGKILDYTISNEKIILEMFFNIYENITDTREILIE